MIFKLVILTLVLVFSACSSTSSHYKNDPTGRTANFWECQDHPQHDTRFDPDGDSVFVDWEFRLFEKLGVCKDWKSYPGNRGESIDGL